jgi:hypothetical protein
MTQAGWFALGQRNRAYAQRRLQERLMPPIAGRIIDKIVEGPLMDANEARRMSETGAKRRRYNEVMDEVGYWLRRIKIHAMDGERNTGFRQSYDKTALWYLERYLGFKVSRSFTGCRVRLEW